MKEVFAVFQTGADHGDTIEAPVRPLGHWRQAEQVGITPAQRRDGRWRLRTRRDWG